jgi:hypothetical protein
VFHRPAPGAASLSDAFTVRLGSPKVRADVDTMTNAI